MGGIDNGMSEFSPGLESESIPRWRDGFPVIFGLIRSQTLTNVEGIELGGGFEMMPHVN